jgi:glutamate--cysteine ligase
LRATAPKLGLKTPFRSGTLLDIARDVLPLSKAGLVKRAIVRDGNDESRYLEPIEAIAADGVTLAERMLQAYESHWHGDLAPIFRAYAY